MNVDAVIRARLDSGGEVKLELVNGSFEAAGTILAMFAEAITGLGETMVVPEPVATVQERIDDPAPAVPRPKIVRARRATNGTGGSVECDVCGKSVKGPVGLGIHRSKAHGISGPTRAPKRAAPEATPPPDVEEEDGDGLLMRCNDCDYTTDQHSFAKLRTHTTISHGRAPYPGVEDRPRFVNALDLVAVGD